MAWYPLSTSSRRSWPGTSPRAGRSDLEIAQPLEDEREELTGRRDTAVVDSAGDNAAIESFVALLQKNVLDRRTSATHSDLRIEIITSIERTYHRRRPQQRLGRLTRIEYETIMTPQAAPAA